MKIELVNNSVLEVESDLLIIGAFEGTKKYTGEFLAVNKATGNLISDYIINKEKFDCKFGETYVLPIITKKFNRKIMLVGLGKQKEFDLPKLRTLSVKIAQKCLTLKNISKIATVLFDFGLKTDKSCQMMVEGISCGFYKFNKYKSTKDEQSIKTFIIAEADKNKIKDAKNGLKTGLITSNAVAETKDLINEPAMNIIPETLAEYAEKNSGCVTKVYSVKEIKKMGMNAFLAVGQGSKNEPKFIHMKYTCKNPQKKIALIGKGITFDSGGMDLKPPSSMLTMKDDMSGAATVISVMKAIAELKPDIEVHGIVAACENMISGKAYKPGDVVTAKNGKTIEIDNTDAEGRVTLADALCYAEELGVSEIIDIATLTGACMVALGNVASGIMGNNQKMTDKIIECGKAAGERYWQLPMYEEYMESLKSEIADMKNTGSRYGGASIAGIFLNNFVKKAHWTHLDVAATAYKDGKGASGIGVLTLINYIFA